jgi:hypothetical protein
MLAREPIDKIADLSHDTDETREYHEYEKHKRHLSQFVFRRIDLILVFKTHLFGYGREWPSENDEPKIIECVADPHREYAFLGELQAGSMDWQFKRELYFSNFAQAHRKVGVVAVERKVYVLSAYFFKRAAGAYSFLLEPQVVLWKSTLIMEQKT